MVPVSAEEWFHVPSSMAEWEEMRLKNMDAATGTVPQCERRDS
jgi:hypothetical protein